MNRIYWVEELTQYVWNVCNEHWRQYVIEKKNVGINGKQPWEKTMKIEKVIA